MICNHDEVPSKPVQLPDVLHMPSPNASLGPAVFRPAQPPRYSTVAAAAKSCLPREICKPMLPPDCITTMTAFCKNITREQHMVCRNAQQSHTQHRSVGIFVQPYQQLEAEQHEALCWWVIRRIS